jgi:hypothetical protein
MNTRELQSILAADLFVQRTNLFGVVACDQLPTRIDRTKQAAFIINLDSSKDEGSHWVGLFFNGLSQFTYFDSFGLPPREPAILAFIKNNSNRPFVYNSRVLQDIVTNSCGLYAVYFVLKKVRGASLKLILHPFSPSPARQYINDRLISRLTLALIGTTYKRLFRRFQDV